MKVWITKYALTEGIFEREVEEENSTGMVTVTDNSRHKQHFHGREWHRTLENAQAQAEKMRTAKLVSIEKQVKRLKELVF